MSESYHLKSLIGNMNMSPLVSSRLVSFVLFSFFSVHFSSLSSVVDFFPHRIVDAQ